MKNRLTLKQRILDTICILLCIGSLIYILMIFSKLPDRIPLNFNFRGEVTGYGVKASVFLLLGIMYLMTAAFSVMVRLKCLYRHINTPWQIPWGKQPIVIRVTKDFICWCNLCVTADNAYLVYGCVHEKLLTLLVWIPYLVLIPLIVWFLLRLRTVCKAD